MSHWLRWQFIVPRVLLVIVVLLAAQYALGIAARNAAIRWCDGVIGVPLKLANARVSLIDQQILLSGIRVANPSQPSENFLEADCCELAFAAEPLFHKQMRFECGRITGLRVNTFSSPSDDVSGDDNLGDVAREWFTSLANSFHLDLVDEFESVERSAALCEQWQLRFAAINGRAEELKSRAADLKTESETAQSNRLRNEEFFNDLPKEIAALRKQYAQLSDEVAKLPQALEKQRRAIVASGRNDQQLLRERLHLKEIDPKTLTSYLLRDQIAEPLQDVLALLSWMGKVAPADGATCRGCQRGEDILFARSRPTPNFLVRALEVQGSAHIGNQNVPFRGMLTGLSSQPRLHNEPIKLRLLAHGSLPLDLHATIDRTGDVARDEVLLDCRGLVLPELCLGDADQLQMNLTSSTGTLSVSARIENGKLAGDIQLVQKQVKITPVLRGNLSDLPLAEPLQSSLGQVNSIATRLTLQGTIDKPSYSLWSNLGPAVAEAMERTLKRSGDDHAQAMLAEARQKVDERLADLERQIADHQAQFASQTTGLQAELESIAGDQIRRGRISAEQLGRTLPDTSLFR